MNKKLFLFLFCMVNFSMLAMENAPENEQQRKLSDSFKKVMAHEFAFHLYAVKKEPNLIPKEYRLEGVQSKEDYYRHARQLQDQLHVNRNNMRADIVEQLKERAYEQVKRDFSVHIGCPNKIAEIFPH